MTQTHSVTIGDLFKVERGNSAYTRAYAEKYPGTNPIYSASLRGALAYSSVADYCGRYITVTVNGYAGRTQIIDGVFSINADRAILIPKSAELQDFDLDYIGAAIEYTLKELVVGRKVDGKKNEYTKVTPEVISDAEIELPILKSGGIDTNRMNQLGNIIRAQNDLKIKLNGHINSLKQCSVMIDEITPSRTIYLGDESYFRLSIGRRLKKSEIGESGIPVFSANVNEPFGYIDGFTLNNKEQPSLIWGIDGNFNWNLINEGIDFYPTDHCGRLQVLTSDIDVEYLFYELNATKEEYGFDRVFRASLSNIRGVRVRIPLDDNGKLNLQKQKLLAAQYRRIAEIKEMTIKRLEDIVAAKLVPSILLT